MFLGKISKQDFGPPPAPAPYRIDFAKNRKKSARGVARIFSGGGGKIPGAELRFSSPKKFWICPPLEPVGGSQMTL